MWNDQFKFMIKIQIELRQHGISICDFGTHNDDQ